MKTYYIFDLMPLEDFIRTSSLRFLTQVWRNFGTFDVLMNPPYVRDINNKLFTEDGNHRCVWSLINGIYTIKAELEEPYEDNWRITRLTQNSAQRSGIFCFNDLVNLVENPMQYSKDGHITHKITIKDLQNKDYFLQV